MAERDEFERILMARPIPEMRSNLAERIIAASLQAPVKNKNILITWMADFLDDFALPKPAYAMAIVLFIGVFVGMNAEYITGVDYAGSDISSYFQAEEYTSMGELS